MNIRNFLYISLASAMLLACNNGPKVISAKSSSETTQTDSGIFSEENTTTENASPIKSSFAEDLHAVVVNEVLPTSMYVYLNVTEAGEQYWIATRKQDIVVGNTYFFRNGILKTNYESKEHNRVFEKIYLVSSLVAEKHGNNSGTLKADFATTNEKEVQKEDIPTHTENIIQHKGSLKIAEIVANPKQYEGKTVQLTGKCIKINPNIMQRNWIHLQDGSKDDFDLVVTSNTFVPEGKVITIRALVTLNRDFGAGYKYDLILENGEVIE